MKHRGSLLLAIVAMLGACSDKNNSPAATPSMTFDDVTVAEGTGGSGTVSLKLVLNQPAPAPVTVTWSTVEGTAKAGQDYTAVTSQAVSFQANEKEKTITVNIVADDIREADETFQIKVENPVNVILLKGSVTVKLTNDDTKVGYNNTGYDAPASYPGYTLAWSDEFNSGSLDAAVWTAETGDGCPGLCGWGNNELEYYTAPPNNLFFQDGKMIIEAKAENFGGKNYTSSRIKTQGKKSFKYGRIDMRAILPKGKGIWPAFWMMPQSSVFGGWPRSGEIDIMEVVGHEPNRLHGTIHYGPGPGSIQISRSTTLPTGTLNDQFHVYSLEWKEDQLKWLLDGVVFSTVNKADLAGNTYPFNEEFYFIMNLAVGGNWPGSPDAATQFPAWFIIDYIRIYQ